VDEFEKKEEIAEDDDGFFKSIKKTLRIGSNSDELSPE
jgi:hypothetical protein